jgi:hypothetical protein
MHHPHASKRARCTAGASRFKRRRRAGRLLGAALAASLPVVGAAAGPALADSHGGTSNFHFRTIDNQRDPTFNQLLGINQDGLIAGYFGSGEAGHPNKGYLLNTRHGQQSYMTENWPASSQTQVTGLNDHGVTVGFWSSTNNAGTGGNPPVNDNRAFVTWHGYFIDGDYPSGAPASPPADQLLGVNDHNVAVGFYTDNSGNTHAYTFNISRNTYHHVTPSGITNPSGAAINNQGNIAGFGTDATGGPSNGQTVGYLLRRGGQVTVLSVPGSSETEALGINDRNEVVGFYTTGSGSSAATHGFTWTPSGGFETMVDDPNGVGATTVNGVNNEGQLVGFYTDAQNNTDGFLASPRH